MKSASSQTSMSLKRPIDHFKTKKETLIQFVHFVFVLSTLKILQGNEHRLWDTRISFWNDLLKFIANLQFCGT